MNAGKGMTAAGTPTKLPSQQLEGVFKTTGRCRGANQKSLRGEIAEAKPVDLETEGFECY